MGIRLGQEEKRRNAVICEERRKEERTGSMNLLM